MPTDLMKPFSQLLYVSVTKTKFMVKISFVSNCYDDLKRNLASF